MTPETTVAGALAGAARRLAFEARLARAAWLALAAAGVAALGLLLGRGLGPQAGEAGLALAGAFGLAALIALAVGRAPAGPVVARRLDTALGRGALVETAAEALAGGHGAFRGVVLGEAAAVLATVELRRLVPVRAPRGSLEGSIAAAILLALALGPASEAAPAPGGSGLVLLAAPSSSGDAPPGLREPAPKNPDAPKVLVPTVPAPDAVPLPPEVARALAQELHALATPPAKTAPTPGEPDRAPSERSAAADAEAKAQARALDAALARGDAAAARAAARALGASSSPDARSALARASEWLEGKKPGGAGSGPGTSPGGPAGGPGPATGPGLAAADPGRAALARPSWRVTEAARRYNKALE